ncbi:hypothetical protein ACFLU4_03370 [Chloroflexota bacterium]
MKNSLIRYLLILVVSASLIVGGAVLLNACDGEVPSPPPPDTTPITPATDEPSLSSDEACARVWAKLPDKLADKYTKAQFKRDTRSARYLGDSKWKFEVLGFVEIREPLPETLKQKADDSWVSLQSESVTTGELRLTADFYERTGIVEISGVEEFNVQTSTETDETPVYPKLQLLWIRATYADMYYEMEGAVLNIGRVPLHDVEAEIANFDPSNTLISTYKEPLDSDTVGVSETARFKIKFEETRTDIHYKIRFLTPSGDLIEYERKEGN